MYKLFGRLFLSIFLAIRHWLAGKPKVSITQYANLHNAFNAFLSNYYILDSETRFQNIFQTLAKLQVDIPLAIFYHLQMLGNRPETRYCREVSRSETEAKLLSYEVQAGERVKLVQILEEMNNRWPKISIAELGENLSRIQATLDRIIKREAAALCQAESTLPLAQAGWLSPHQNPQELFKFLVDKISVEVDRIYSTKSKDTKKYIRLKNIERDLLIYTAVHEIKKWQNLACEYIKEFFADDEK